MRCALCFAAIYSSEKEEHYLIIPTPPFSSNPCPLRETHETRSNQGEVIVISDDEDDLPPVEVGVNPVLKGSSVLTLT